MVVWPTKLRGTTALFAPHPTRGGAGSAKPKVAIAERESGTPNGERRSLRGCIACPQPKSMAHRESGAPHSMMYSTAGGCSPPPTTTSYSKAHACFPARGVGHGRGVRVTKRTTSINQFQYSCVRYIKGSYNRRLAFWYVPNPLSFLLPDGGTCRIQYVSMIGEEDRDEYLILVLVLRTSTCTDYRVLWYHDCIISVESAGRPAICTYRQNYDL